MNILILSLMLRKHTSRQHLGFFDKLKEYDDCNVFIYGNAELHDYIGNLKLKFMELYKKHNPDIVIGYCHVGTEMFDRGDLFDEMKCAKIFIENDFWRVLQTKKYGWYHRQKFDIMMHRNGYDNKEIGIPSAWLPWSADDKEFFPNDKLPRRNIIGFAGSSVSNLYSIRKKAITTLEDFNLIENKKKQIMSGEYIDGVWKDQNKYQEWIKSITAILTSTEQRGPFAKTFEAMASKTVVLTSPIINDNILFPIKDSFVQYNKDSSNLVKKAKMILNEPEYSQSVAENGYKCFINNHTSKKRIDELYQNIKNLLASKRIIRKWSI